MKELMRIEGLKMYFGGLKAIDGLDLTINEGETLGIIGPNGAGKTTLFNAICGVYKPTDGKVILKGQEVQGLRTRWRAWALPAPSRFPNRWRI